MTDKSQEEMAAMYLAAKQSEGYQQASRQQMGGAPPEGMSQQQQQQMLQQQQIMAMQQQMQWYQQQGGRFTNQNWNRGGKGGNNQQQYLYAQNFNGEAGEGEGGMYGGYAPQYGGGNQQEEEMHPTVRAFIEELKTAVEESNVKEMDELYMKDYNKLSDQIAKQKLGNISNKFPGIEQAKQFLGEESVSLILLYKELYYRHIYAKCDKQITGDERIQSWETYRDLFEKIMKDIKTENAGNADPETNSKLILPLSWIWDILNEFLYQYQQYMQFRAKAIFKKGKNNPGYVTAEYDLNIVKEHPEVWDPIEVKTLLLDIINITGIEGVLSRSSSSSNEQTKFLGYFALVQLVRYHIMDGHYDEALKIVATLDYGKRDALYYTSPACHCTLTYYFGFTMMMQQRYSDAIVIFSDLLYFIKKTDKFQVLHNFYETADLKRLQEKMYLLLGMCYVLSPDDFYAKVEKYILDITLEKVMKLKETNFGPQFNKDITEFFHLGAPKFITIVPLPSHNSVSGEDAAAEGGKKINPVQNTEDQSKFFLKAVEQQKIVPLIRSFLKMFTSISLSKLAQLSGLSETELLEKLKYVKEKSKQTVMDRSENISSGGAMKVLPGVEQLCTALDFEIDEKTKNISVVMNTKEVKYTEYFTKQIKTLQALQNKLIIEN